MPFLRRPTTEASRSILVSQASHDLTYSAVGSKTSGATPANPGGSRLQCPTHWASVCHRGTTHGSGLGIYRWVVERTGSWLHSFRKLRLRTDRTAAIHEAFVALACSLIYMWFL
jgi:hypothetical protein